MNSGLGFSPDFQSVTLCLTSQTDVDFAENINWSRATHVTGAQRAIAQAGNNAISVGDGFPILGLNPYGDTAWALRSSAATDAAYTIIASDRWLVYRCWQDHRRQQRWICGRHGLEDHCIGQRRVADEFGGAGEDIARTVTSTVDGGGLVAGTSNGSMFLMKLDTAGGVTWRKLTVGMCR